MMKLKITNNAGRFEVYDRADLNLICNIRDCLYRARDKFPDTIAYRQFVDHKREVGISFKDFVDQVDALGTALVNLNFENQHIAIIGETSIEWLMTYFAVINGVGVAVPIDKELTEENITIQLNSSEAEVVFVSAKSAQKVMNAVNNCDKSIRIIIMREYMMKDTVDKEKAMFLSDIMDIGKKLVAISDRSYIDKIIDNQTLALIDYTSGTTGANKGVMLSHQNILSCAKGAGPLIRFGKVFFSILPINHTYELNCSIIGCLIDGTTVCINDELSHILRNLKLFKPDMTCMVPEILEGFVKKVVTETEKKGRKKELLRSIRISNILRKIGIDIRHRLFSEVREAFGGKLEKVICGGAPMPEKIEYFMESIGIRVVNGYGITECSPLVALNVDSISVNGSAGRILENCNVRIWKPDSKGNGEIQVKGPNVMLGYYGLPEDTTQVFTDDGWFRTGDVGFIDTNNFLYVTGRLKNVIILPNGKNVYPEDVEEHLKKDIPYVEEVIICADANNSGVCAICHLNEEYCMERGLVTWRECYEHILPDISSFNKKVESCKRVSSVFISMDGFEKTTTHKIKRYEIERKMKNDWKVARDNPDVR